MSKTIKADEYMKWDKYMGDNMDRQTAAELLDNLVGMVDDTQGNNYDTALKMGIEALRAERHGEWIQKSTGGESFYTCSRCGFIAWEHEDTNYCPNCGARMDG